MGKEIVYCTECGDRISAADFERGRAATVLARHYCHGCSEVVVMRAPPKDVRRQGMASPLRKLYPRRSLPAEGSGAPSQVPYLIAGAVGLIALVFFICLFWSGSGAATLGAH
jgi:hypothetical protein